MSSEKRHEGNENHDKRLEQVEQTGTFLDSLRGLAHKAHTKILVLAALAGISTMSCNTDDPNIKKDDPVETKEGYEACAPFLRCGAAPRPDQGFTLVYEVPQYQVFEGTEVVIYDKDGKPIHEDTIDFPSGSALLDFSPSDIPGVEDAAEVVLRPTINGQTHEVTINVDFAGAQDVFNGLD